MEQDWEKVTQEKNDRDSLKRGPKIFQLQKKTASACTMPVKSVKISSYAKKSFFV